MKIEKHHIHLIPIIAVAVIGTFLAFTSWIKILAQTASMTITPPVCAFNYSDWSSCNSSGIQTRSITSKTPINCVGGTIDSLSKNCTYTSTTTYTVPVCAYTYSDWSSCSSSGTQTRSIASKSPSGCSGGTQETLSRSCTYTPTITTSPICSFTYSDWSSCSSSGTQTRSVISRYPDNCIGGTYETSRNCTYVPPSSGDSSSGSSTSTTNCTSTCSSWSSCYADGYQDRNCTAPTGCGTIQSWSEKKSCTYTATSSSNTSGSGTSTVITTPTTLNCNFSCSSWSGCGTDGFQARTCTAPSGCPTTSWMEKKSCTYNTGSTSGGTLTTSSTLTPTTGGISTLPTGCIYQCSSWSDCYPAGYQDRMCQKPSETSCTAVQEKQYCAYSGSTASITASTNQTACAYQCSNWGVCSPAGIKSQSCWPSPAGCSGEAKTVTQPCSPLICKFTYSSWGACADGFQFRTILTSGLAGCVGGEPILQQGCTASESASSGQAESTQTAVATSTGPVDPEISVNDDWKKEVFKTSACSNQVCGGDVDPDKDGLTNNDEYRYGTNPLDPDTDNDGKKDGEEVAAGTDPLKSSAKGEEDKIVFENPKEAGTVKTEIYQVTNVEMVAVSESGQKQMKLTGKGPANSYINVYIYSGEPVIVTVKTDSNGDWTYTVDRELEDGNHEVYVAVTNNTGAIKAKSEPLPFVKTAQAVSVANAEKNIVEEKAKEKSGISIRSLLFIFALAFFGVVVAVILIGVVIKKIASKVSLS